jgi:predicted nuclease with RNAse H fold
VRALGIDVGVGPKWLDLVLMDERRVPLRVQGRVAPDLLGPLIRELEPDAIAIDAPPGWATSGRSRRTERDLAEFNIHAFNTPSARNGRASRFYEWMEVGFRAFRVAARAGFPRYAAGPPRGTAMEVFPHATATVLAGCLPPRGARKRAWRESVLRAQGVWTDDLVTADHVDAALAALTGVIALQGRHFAPGEPREGVIVLPVAALPARPYRHCPDEGADAPPPLFRICGCGDPSCAELVRGEFAPGHDAKRKSILWQRAREGQDAADELRRRGWEIPPEMR